MANLAAAHKGYFYQDIVTAYFLARSLVERVQSTTVDAKFHAYDRFDDLLSVMDDGTKVRRQFKHSESPKAFERSFLTSDSCDLRLDQLIKSWLSDPAKVRATEYRVCVTWRIPNAKDDRCLLKHSTAPSSFGGQSSCFQLDVDVIWPKRGQPQFRCLKNTKRAAFVAFAKRLIIELECPRASLDLDHAGPMEQLLLNVLGDRVGFGRYPNQQRGPVEAAAQLILLAYKTRGTDLARSTLTPDVVIAELGLITDYGRISQQFPFNAGVFVSMPELRRKLNEKVKAGGITVLSGKPGAGKSWELTDLMKKLRARKVIVAAHYCYLEPGDPLVQSRITLNTFYGNLIAEIVDAVPELSERNPTRYAAGPQELQALLDAAGAMNPAPRLVVIVDGLDHIARVLRDARTLAPADTQIARDLLALKLPENVSVLVGSQPGDHITQLARSGTVLSVPDWEEPEVEAFLGRIPLGKKLKAQCCRDDDRSALIAELTRRSQGNALYCTYLCRELERRLEASPGAEPLTLLRVLPANEGKLSTYYEFLLDSLDTGGRLVGEVMGLIDFGITPEELQEIFPLFRGRIEEFLTQLAPILERTRGQGGLRIYHESFRRHLFETAATKANGLAPSLKDVIAWLDGKGFLSDSRAFRFLLPNLVRAERACEVFDRIDRDFVVKAVAEGHPTDAIAANLGVYSRVASDVKDFPKLVRAGELIRALGTCNDNLNDVYEYGTTYAAIFGADNLAQRLSFDGAPTFDVSEGLKLCSFCADAGVSPPWHAYLRKPRPSEEQQDMRAEMARFHGRARTGEGDRLRARLVEFLGKAGDDVDSGYVAGLARRWAEVAGADDLPHLTKESKCNVIIAEIFDLEFARRTLNAQNRKAAATRVARRTTSAHRAIEALRLGADPKLLTHWTNDLGKYEIGVGGRGIGKGEALPQWVLSVRIAAYVQPKLLDAEEIRTRGSGWYRNWLAFVIELARIERRAVHSPANAAEEVVDAFRALATDVNPFKGSPRACDLYFGRGAIHESFEVALNLLQTSEQWRCVIAHLKKISSGTTTSLQRSKSGPLTAYALVELVAPFARRKELHASIRREIEPLIRNQHDGGLYHEIASAEMALASLLITMGDRVAALEHWKTACLHLCAYGMRKDTTIFELLNSIEGLMRAGKPQLLERLAKLLPMVHAVILHTDGRETRHSAGTWFKRLFAVDESSAAWLLGRSMTDDGGSYDYRLEDGLVHWLENVSTMDTRWRCRLEQLVEGPSDVEEVKRRLGRIDLLRNQNPAASGLEFQLMAATVHGDPVEHPQKAYDTLLHFAKKSGFVLPVGDPDISHPKHKDNTPALPSDSIPPKLRWQPPKTPLALLQRFQKVLHGREVSNEALLDYCKVPMVGWSDSHRPEIEEILTFIARSNRFGTWADLLTGLGKALESAGKTELAAHALTLAFAGHRGGGGWMSFGDENHEDLLMRAFKNSRPVALTVLAQEMMHRNGEWGVTQHVIGFLGRHDDIALATAMWDEACESILVRLPGHEAAQGPFLSFEPTAVPTWTPDDAALFLILARISHPELRRKTTALCAAAWLVQRDPAKCVIAFREILKASLCFTHQLWLLNLLEQFEPTPYVITQALVAELNAFIASGRCGTEQLALMLLTRARVTVSGRPARTKPIVPTALPLNKIKAIMSLDVHDVVQRVAKFWPEFPELVAGRFETIMRSDELHKDRMQDRREARMSISRRSYPWAMFHGWENELFTDSLNEVLTGLEEHLWLKGEWDDRVWLEVLPLLLPHAEIPARHYWSRRVRPSWPLPAAISNGVHPVQSVPDGELSGWKRIAYFETYFAKESSFDEIKLSTRVTAGVMLNDKIEPLPQRMLPLRESNNWDWRRKARPLFPLGGFSGAVAGHSLFGTPFQFHELLGLAPNLANTLNLSGRPEIGPLDLFDADEKLAVAFRWWRCRPLGDHGFADETPRLSGGALMMRPDIFEQILSETKLQAFEVTLLQAENTEQLIAKHTA
ncbi:hypothetical protein M2103_001836 [Ereboglobus sp. PH5-5]|uniref:ATP-binding protein n=1 Tax=unclassified Ereboglobus TaxID=2626932 RepID=UPI0024059D7E|nr:MULTISPECIES: ATP-binding protein [unclassified Ereboglobus]MDF9828462.1 hypothetical protein [Ereboglobus sp. PH5-10]MDF9833604.1 hypothetical protein [Ereboglobus sp. PH5-5]